MITQKSRSSLVSAKRRLVRRTKMVTSAPKAFFAGRDHPLFLGEIPQTKIKPMQRFLPGFDEAMVKSRRAGRPLTLHIHIDPKGPITVFGIDESVPSVSPDLEQSLATDSSLEAALDAARERGRIRAAEILAQDDMLTGQELGKRLGMSRMAVNTKRQNGQLLGLAGAKRGFRYPFWQLNAEGKPYAELETLHKKLGGPWEVYRFLVQRHPELEGLTGRQAFERKKAKAALKVADSVGRDFS